MSSLNEFHCKKYFFNKNNDKHYYLPIFFVYFKKLNKKIENKVQYICTYYNFTIISLSEKKY